MGRIEFTNGALFMETNNPYEPPKKLCAVTDMDVVEDFEEDESRKWIRTAECVEIVQEKNTT